MGVPVLTLKKARPIFHPFSSRRVFPGFSSFQPQAELSVEFPLPPRDVTSLTYFPSEDSPLALRDVTHHGNAHPGPDWRTAPHGTRWSRAPASFPQCGFSPLSLIFHEASSCKHLDVC